MLAALQEIFTRDLFKLQEELRLYPSDEAVWALHPGIRNSAGTLTLHLLGNLNHFIGATFGNTGYVRDRDKEFSTRDVPRNLLYTRIDAARGAINHGLAMLRPEELEKEYPLPLLGRTLRNDHMLIHLATHLGYHLGQVNYHRRLVAA